MKSEKEKEVEEYYKQAVLQVEKELRTTGETSSLMLTKLGRKLFGLKYAGTYAVDRVPKLKNTCYFILNTDASDKRGTHWVSCFFNGKKTYYVYDSFGRKSSRLLPIFINGIKARNATYKDSDYDAEQTNSEANCGMRCLAWLICIEKFGIRKAMLI
jgi:hypothetical protein